MKEQTGAGADVGSGLDVRFRLQPVEKDLDRLPDAADVRGRGVLGHQSVVFLPLCSPQVAETGFADLYGARNRQYVRAQLGENVQLDAVLPEVFRRIPRQIAELSRCFRSI